jgi:hypothetical protein
MNINDIRNSYLDPKELEAERDKESRKRDRTNMFSGIILSLATVISSWCAFQSSQWNGEQYFKIDDENIADNKRLQKEIVAIQRKAGESNYFLYYLDALAAKDKKRITFLEARFPPHLKQAILAWKATDPLNNELAPRSPFQMEEYIVPEIEEAKVFAKQAGEFKKAANQADKNSDNYLLLSIVISMVLFFTGLAGISKSFHFQKILLATSITILVLVIIYLLKMPAII